MDSVHFVDWMTLVGFMGQGEALNYVKSQGFEIKDEGEWKNRIQRAVSHVASLASRVNPTPEVKELDLAFNERLMALKSEPTFQEHQIGMKGPPRLAQVELSPIRCFQTQLNTEYLLSQTEQAPSPDDLESTVKFCLPTKDERQKTPMLASVNPTSNTFAAVTENLDLRIIGNVQGEDAATGRKFAGFAYGFGLPQISVVEYRGIYVLKNGYHRAYALLKKGHRYLPCLLLSTDSFQFTGAQAPGFFSVDMLVSKNGPILSDFGSEAMVVIPRRRLRVMVTIHGEVQVVPV